MEVMIFKSITIFLFSYIQLTLVSGYGYPYAEMGMEECCPMKKISGSEDPGMDGVYVLVRNGSVSSKCESSCIYKKMGDNSGAEYCFKPSNDVQSECQNGDDGDSDENGADDAGGGDAVEGEDPAVGPKPSKSTLGQFSNAAVASDSVPCAAIGKNILLMGGTAVDSAVATLFCTGVTTSQSMGIGGGFLMTIFLSNGTKIALVAREMAPAAVTTDMFVNKSSTLGPRASGVPGEIKGYWEAKQRYGNPNITWAQLIQPTITLCEDGIPVSGHLAKNLKKNEAAVRADPGLKSVFINKEEDRFHKEGEFYKHPKLAETLRKISDGGADEFYKGSIANDLISDMQAEGGIMTLDDLMNYNVSWETPAETDIPNTEFKLLSSPPPGSGAILSAILGISGQYNPIPSDKNRALLWHRFSEACKFGYAKRTILGDWNFQPIKDEITDMVNEVTSDAWQSQIMSNISDFSASNDTDFYGANFYNVEDSGTAHVSIVSPTGDAVSVTSTVNLAFGSKFMSTKTGIILNNQMDDFSYPDIINTFGVPPSVNNFVGPGKRPVSSMSPSIVVDKDNRVVAVIGASGGTKIITSVAQVLLRTLYLGQDVKQAVDSRRLHNQLYPDETKYEIGTTKWTVNGLANFNQKMVRFPVGGSVIQAIVVDRDTGDIMANADFRKGGSVDGF